MAIALLAAAIIAGRQLRSHASRHSPAARDQQSTILARVAPPPGYRYVRTAPGSFEQWLTGLPLKRGRPPVRLYDGREKRNQQAHYAVVDLDVGDRDLQQCADAIIRLRAEYLYEAGRYADIHFNFTSGDRADFERWSKGYRPLVIGDSVRWLKRASSDGSYETFRKYLTTVFRYAGTRSLRAELTPVTDVSQMRIGDVFIRAGSPGHAVIVVNMAESKRTGKRVFLLAQSYMPAQDIHILRNPADAGLSPWYQLDLGDRLITPEFVFRKEELRRF